jgi:hypothetical protein
VSNWLKVVSDSRWYPQWRLISWYILSLMALAMVTMPTDRTLCWILISCRRWISVTLYSAVVTKLTTCCSNW